jgi:proteasomal ATPase-associated factor 1
LVKLPYFSVQFDWEISVQKDFQPFWWSCTDNSGRTTHGKASVEAGPPVNVRADPGCTMTVKLPATLLVSASPAHYEVTAALHKSQPFPSSKSRPTVLSMDISPGGELGISGGFDGGLRVWEAATGTLRRELGGHRGDVNNVKFFPSGEVVLSCSSDWQVKIWSVTEGYCAASLSGHSLGVLGSSIVERGRNVISCSRDGTARLWDVSQQATLNVFRPAASTSLYPPAVLCCALALNEAPLAAASAKEPEVGTDGKLLALGGENGHLTLFDLRARTEVATLSCGAAVNAITALPSLPHLLLAGDEAGTLRLYDLRALRSPLHAVQRTRAPVRALAVDGSSVWVGQGDGDVWDWDATSGAVGSRQLSGADADAIHGLVARRAAGDSQELAVYSACRDGYVRRYLLAAERAH